MKIGVAAEDESGLEAEISMHFGRCPYYILLEADDGKIRERVAVIRNPYAGVRTQPGQIPSFLTDYGIQVIIVGGMGPTAVGIFTSYGIKVVTGTHGKVKEAVTSFLRGELPEREPKEFASKYHSLYHGKIGVELKAPVRDYNDFAIWYTPGVAEPCKVIQQDTSAVFKYTNRGNLVGIVTDGTRVLGLGDIGPEGALPVMEGKSMLFKYLGGVDAFPICLDTKDPDEIIRAVKWLVPTFGGINLEDIAKPKCFYILDRLRKELDIPVWHDDQQGTALVTLAALMSALKVVGKRIDDISMAFVGAGAANINCVRYTILAGADPDRLMVVDSKGILHRGRSELKETEPTKWDICEKTNRENRIGGVKQALKGADVCIALSRPGPGVIKKEWVAKMANNAIVFTCANPIPEIWPWDAREAGARIMATGRSDFPNQVNNSLGFPAVFRGALDVAARRITDGMCLAASRAISGYAEKKGLSDDYIIPSMGETDMFVEEAVAVGLKAIEEGVGRLDRSAEELRESASSAIKMAQETVKLRMERGLIKSLPN